MPTSRAAAIAASTITSADVAAPENRLAEAINSIPNSASLWKLSDTLPQARKQDESSHNSNLALLGKKPPKDAVHRFEIHRQKIRSSIKPPGGPFQTFENQGYRQAFSQAPPIFSLKSIQPLLAPNCTFFLDCGRKVAKMQWTEGRK